MQRLMVKYNEKVKSRQISCCLLLVMMIIVMPKLCYADMKVYFFDVGQGDSILIQCDGHNMLVDAGPQEAGSDINKYLRDVLEISVLDVVIATHEHDDHLFGMPAAVAGLSVGTVYSPTAVPMTYWFEQVLPGLKGKSLKLRKPQTGDAFMLGEAKVIFLNPLQQSENANNLSLVLRLEYGSCSVLLMGDLEGDGEVALLEDHANLKADILKVGHHGGNTSTTDAFLRAVDPAYAVISVGKGNKHGHPHLETINKLKKRGVSIYRTDEFGTIVMTSDGQNWMTEVSKAK